MANLGNYQTMVARWVDYNFGPKGLDTRSELTEVGGLGEEYGELARAAVKMAQGIRGTQEEWMIELRKEAADVLIKLLSVCDWYDFSLENALAERWAEISQRDWVADRQGHGIDKDD